MMQSISHWGQFEIPAHVASAYKPEIARPRERIPPTSFFVSRQDGPEDPKRHEFY